MKKNNGFTFVELLVVIALLSIVLILTISQVQRVNNNSKIKLCKNKLSLIEESLNLYLTNNRSLFSSDGLCDEKPVSGICYTSVLKIAKQGIIDYDKDENIINPVNNKLLNDYKVKIIYDSSNDKFSSEIQIKKENETVSDENYNTICGKSTGIKEEDNDRSFFEKKSYDFKIIKIEEDGSEHELDSGQNSVEKAINEIGNYCKSLSFKGIEDYSYERYDIKDENTVNCIYKKGIRYSLSIEVNGKGIVVDINKYTSKKYKLNESVIINFKIEGNYFMNNDSISCNVSDSCEYNPKDSTIKVTFKNEEDIVLTINSKDMLNVGMYYENPDEDNKYDTDTSNNQLFATVDEAKEYCNNHIKENYVFDKENGYNKDTKGCYYKLKRTNLSFDLRDTNIVSVLVDPGSKTMSGTTPAIDGYYKYGQKITLKVNYKNGYEYGSIVCESGECTLNDDGTITLVSYADEVLIRLESKIIPPKYMIYHHYQDADDINGYSSVLISNDEPVNNSITESNLLATYCDATVGIYKYVSTISFYNTTNHEVNCYYDRDESVTVTFDQLLYNVRNNSSLDDFDLKLTPNNSKDVSTIDGILRDTSKNKHTYRYGQEIVLTISGYSNVPNKEPVTCNSNNECIINTNGTFKTTVSNNLTFKPGTVEYKVYNHYQDADDINGYSTEVGTSENVSMTNTDSTNYANVCGKQSNKNSTYTYNSSLSYLDSSKKEIDCYFDRNKYKVTFVKGNASPFDSNVSKINIVPASSIVLGLTSLTNNSTAIEYRHGQEIIINKSDFETDYQLDSVTCSDSNQCTIGKDGVARVTVPTNNNLKVYVKSKPTEIEYKVYHHYQDADDINGYTADFVKTIGIVLSVGDDKNYNNECNQSKDGFTYNKTISYLDRSKKEINCYYDRNESVSVTFDSKDLNNIKTKSSLSNFALTLTPNTSKDVATTTINLSSPGTHTYRYGQEIVLTISGYVNVPGVEPVTCNSNNECIINSNGTFKTTLNNKITFKPGTVEYKVYNHYQDVDNVNGFTSELADPVTISMAVADDINRNNICEKQKNKGTHTLKTAISYLESSRKEINCYFERK